MITVCTVLANQSYQYFDAFVKSLAETCPHVSQLVVTCLDGSVPAELHGLSIESIPVEYPAPFGREFLWHAVGLHECLIAAKGDYILLSDPDIIYKAAVTEVYLDLIRYGIDYVGISFHTPEIQPYHHFPVVTNLMCRRSSLPALFLNEYKTQIWDQEITIGPYWLLPGETPEFSDQYPNPTAQTWDTGHRLYLHAKMHNKKWLAFQTDDEHNYTTRYVANSVLDFELPTGHLLYHEGSSFYKPLAESRMVQKGILK